MSAFVVSDDTLRRAVIGFATVVRQYGERFTATGASGQSHVLDVDTLNQIARDFYALNVRAVNGRYNEDSDTTLPGDIFQKHELLYAPFFLDCFQRRGVIAQLKSLECLSYQCAEDATINDPLYAVIQEAQGKLALYIVKGMEEYKDAAWG